MKSRDYFFILFLMCMGDAHAYLDPGTGSIFLQGLLASLLAGGVFFGNIKTWIFSFFIKKKSEDISKGKQ